MLENLKPAIKFLRERGSSFDDPEYILNNAGVVELGKMHWIISTKFSEIDGVKFLSEQNSRDYTLHYIQTLMEQGKLKARRFIYVQRPPRTTEESKKENATFYDISETIIYQDADEAIRDIREAWNNTAHEDLTVFEMSVHFTLPDTPWSAV